MALAAVAYAKAMRGRRIMIATSSIGPGSTNMVTAAAVAHANRLPVLLFSGDTFQHRIVDPVLQQVEHFDDPTLTVTDAFKPVSRYWDRITKPAQIVRSLPQALAVMLDPATRGPAFFALPQDVQAEAYDFPARFFEPRVHYIRRPGPDPRDVQAAAALIERAQRPLIVAGGGVHYSGAVEALRSFAERHGIPVVETVAGKSTLTHDHPNYAGPIGVTGSTCGERRRREGRRRHRRRDAAPGLHDGIVVGVRRSGRPVRGRQHRPLGRAQAGGPAGRRRRQGLARGDRRGARHVRGPAGVAGDRRRADLRVARLSRLVVRAKARRPTGLCRGHPGHQHSGRTRRLHRLGRGRPARRAEHGLALEVGRVVRLGVRLLDDGLRDRRRLGRAARPAEGRRHRLGRRRFLPDDEFRHLLDRHDRPEGHLHGLRQRRLRRHQPAPGEHRRGRVQQPAPNDAPRALFPGRLREARRIDGGDRGAGRERSTTSRRRSPAPRRPIGAT